MREYREINSGEYFELSELNKIEEHGIFYYYMKLVQLDKDKKVTQSDYSVFLSNCKKIINHSSFVGYSMLVESDMQPLTPLFDDYYNITESTLCFVFKSDIPREVLSNDLGIKLMDNIELEEKYPYKST